MDPIIQWGEFGRPRTFTARRHVEDGSWWADSDQIPGWTAVANDEAELYRLVCEAPAVYLGWPAGEYNVVLLWTERFTTDMNARECA